MYKKKDRPFKEERTTLPQRRRTPSFSSSLLDAVYRSIDDEGDNHNPVSKKQSNSVPPSRGRSNFLGEDTNYTNKLEIPTELRRAIMVEAWMERQSTRSTSSSSDSSSSKGGRKRRGKGGFFSSSSEAESSTKGTQPCKGLNFSTTKLRALKIYDELKKVKQPISPGGKIANFLNSIFNSGGAKKVKMCSIGAMEDVSFKKPKSSSCSTSSFSRSCLSKTPPSSGTKRSVRFYPVSVIVGEDSRPCGHKCIYGDQDPWLMPVTTRKGFSNIKSPLVEEDKKNARVSISDEFGLKGFPSYLDYDSDGEEEEEEEEDGDDLSCSSSDLFELDHLIGIGRYREELPVYETTSLKTNQAIANGFFV